MYLHIVEIPIYQAMNQKIAYSFISWCVDKKMNL